MTSVGGRPNVATFTQTRGCFPGTGKGVMDLVYCSADTVWVADKVLVID